MTRQLSRPEATAAVLSWAPLHDIAAAVDKQQVGRPRQHPLALHLAWSALARIHGSNHRLDIETSDRATWRRYIDLYNTSAAAHPRGETVDPHADRLTSHTHRHLRDNLTLNENLVALSKAFTAASVNQAQALGLIQPNGPGSLTHPSKLRTIYGDGTILRPLYRNREPERGRVDTDAEEHTRHDGTIVGNNIVFVAVRGPQQHRRIILAVDRVDTPGNEAATAINNLHRVIDQAAGGVQGVVYDGALRGIHIHTLMDAHGVVVINKVHPATRNGDERTYRTIPLGTWTHKTPNRACAHQLVIHHGNIHEAITTDDGTITNGPALEHTQIRRHRRADGTWRMNLGITLPCRHGSFTAWVNPHPQPGDRHATRPDQLRLIPEDTDEFASIYGLRNDAEAINSEFKRTLIVDRAPALGWRRQLLAALSWAIHNNARAAWLHEPRRLTQAA